MDRFSINKSIVMGILVYLCIVGMIFTIGTQYTAISIECEPDSLGSIQIYYDNNLNEGMYFDEQHSEVKNLEFSNKMQEVSIDIPFKALRKVRVDFNGIEDIRIKTVGINIFGFKVLRYNGREINEVFNLINDVEIMPDGKELNIHVVGDDAFIGNESISIKHIYLGLMCLSLFIALIVYIIIHIIVKKISREKILITLFLSILLIPTIAYKFILQDTGSSTENRVLKDKPDLNLKTLTSYPKEFEEYFNDHIPFKQQATQLNSYVKYNYLNMSPAEYIIKGRDNWLFYNSKAKNDTDALGDYLGTTEYSMEELEQIKENLLDKRDYLKKKGIEFYIMICPNKEVIYYEYMPTYYNRKSEINKADKLVKYLEENTDLNIVYPKQELLMSKGKYNTYYKWDTHWNQIGAYIGFESLMNAIGDETISSFKEIEFIPYDRAGGDLVNMLSILPSGMDYDYVANNYKTEIESSIFKEEGSKVYYKSNSLNDKKLLLFRDSFGEALMPYLSKAFSESIVTSDRSFDPDFIESEKPDIVVFEVVERGIDVLKQ